MNVNRCSSEFRSSIVQKMDNVVAADRSRTILLIFNEIMECISKNGLSLQQIETGLREKNCFSYLIARKPKSSYGADVSIELPIGTIKTYQLFISTRAPEIAMKELLEESSSYAENFAKLNDTGFLSAKEDKPLWTQFNGSTLALNSEGVKKVLSDIQKHN